LSGWHASINYAIEGIFMSQEAVAEGAGPPTPIGSGKKTGLVIIMTLVVVLAAGGGGWWFSRQKHHAAPAADAAKKAERKAGVFAPRDSFTVNLGTTDTEHFLQIGSVLETTGSPVADAIKTNTSLTRNKMLYLSTGKSADALATNAGKTKLAAEWLTVARNKQDGLAAAGAAAAERSVTDVRFASFIVQQD